MKSRDTEQPGVEQGYQYALRLLAARDYTTLKLGHKLLARGLKEADIEAVLARLTEKGLLNDQRFAERFAESTVLSGRFFGTRLKLEMRRRGIPCGLADEIAGRMNGACDEVEEMNALLERRYPGFSFAEATDRDKRRVISYLQRRGFSSSVINKVLRHPVR